MGILSFATFSTSKERVPRNPLILPTSVITLKIDFVPEHHNVVEQHEDHVCDLRNTGNLVPNNRKQISV